jgi:alkylhydroperoxidase family enzyme
MPRSLFSHKKTFVRYTLVEKGSWGSEMFAVASQRIYIRVGREMCCGFCDHQHPPQLNQATIASPSHDLRF